MTRPAKIWISPYAAKFLASGSRSGREPSTTALQDDDIGYVREDIVVKLVEALDLCDAVMAAIIPYAEGFVPDDIFVNLKERRQLAKSVLAECGGIYAREK